MQAAASDEVAVSPPGGEDVWVTRKVELLRCLLNGASQPAAVVEADDLLVRDPTTHILGDPSAATAQLTSAVSPGRLAAECRSNPSIYRTELRESEPEGGRRPTGERAEHLQSVAAWLDAEAGASSVGGQAVGDLEPPHVRGEGLVGKGGTGRGRRRRGRATPGFVRRPTLGMAAGFGGGELGGVVDHGGVEHGAVGFECVRSSETATTQLRQDSTRERQ